MKKLLLFQTVFLLSSFCTSNSFGQSIGYLSRAYPYIEKEYGLDHNMIGDLKIKSQYLTQHNQVTHVHFVQTFNDVEIFGTEINLAFLPDGNILSVGHRLIRLDKTTLPKAKVKTTAPEAIGIAASSLGVSTRSVPQLSRTMDNGIPLYDKSDISLQDIPVEIGYMLTPSGVYRLAYKMQLDVAKLGSLYQSYVDAATGESIVNENLTLHCQFEEGYLQHESNCDDATVSFAPPVSGVAGQYRVIPTPIESPNHGNFALVTGVDDPTASPFGWHDTNGSDGAEYTYTRGNNVHAFLDRNWDYAPDDNLDGGVNLIFDFPYDPNLEPVGNENVAVTNLFYWNNIMHDFSFQYGFDEVSGNFQARNYSGQGQGADYVEAHSQFGDNSTTQCGTEANGGTECVNNADFSTPVDGLNGRMRMFTWNLDNSSKFLDILEPAELSGKILTGAAQFGPDITTTAVTGQVIEINDGTFNGSKGCNPVTNQPELEGKIALIDRGVCDFSLKVYNAQEAGAIGAIICNFEEATIPMGAGDNAADVTIPSVFISSGECARIRIAAGNGLVASLVAPTSGGPTKRDGSLDDGVMAHEYTHGISTRLTGGPGNSGCLSGEEQMGEGWSDFFALVTTVQSGDTGAKKRGIGTYASKEAPNGRGIRTYPYSTDMSIDPHTYDNILLESVPHGVGSVWCVMLWDLYWALSDQYGWDPDLYHGTGGNNIAIQLVIDGMKLQPCAPGFIDGRDAILQADMINNGGANQCLIWKVFARRGLGFNAVGGSSASRSDGKEGFDLPTSCRDEVVFTKTQTPEIIAGDNIEVTLKFINYKDFNLTNVFIEDPVPNGCSYLPGSANIAPATGNSLVWSIASIAPDEEVTITYLLRTDHSKNSIQLLYDDMENLPEDRWDVYFDAGGTQTNFWYTQDALVHSGSSAWAVEDVATESKHYLQNLDPYHIAGNYPLYRFYHYYNTETGADGGFLEISADNGTSWFPLEDRVFRNGYPRKLQYTTFAIPNLFAYSGLSYPSFKMTPVYVDLSDYIGQDVKIRYTFGTDDNIALDGWYVDDVEIMDAVVYNSEACVTSDQLDAVCTEAPERGTIVDTQIASSTGDHQGETAFQVMPNPAGDLIQVVMSAKKSEQANVTIYDLTGHLLSADEWNLAEGINQKTIDISRFTPGMYVMQVKAGDGMRSEKFVKE